MKKKVWTNKKFKGEWTGSYKWLNPNERVFCLSRLNRVISLESPQMAKRLGWVAIN